MRRTSIVALSTLLGLAVCLPAAAQWKWRDKGGHIQYSDLPPPQGTSEQDILQRPTPTQSRRVSVVAPAASAASAASAAPAPKGVDPELEARRKKAEQEQSNKQKAEDERVAAARADNCVRARSYMRTLDEGTRVVRHNEKGEREVLDDKQRADEVRRTREVIASDCK
jgi:Domain of unknown function (DUF4124)